MCALQLQHARRMPIKRRTVSIIVWIYLGGGSRSRTTHYSSTTNGTRRRMERGASIRWANEIAKRRWRWRVRKKREKTTKSDNKDSHPMGHETSVDIIRWADPNRLELNRRDAKFVKTTPNPKTRQSEENKAIDYGFSGTRVASRQFIAFRTQFIFQTISMIVLCLRIAFSPRRW